jgi:hypothetical protein
VTIDAVEPISIGLVGHKLLDVVPGQGRLEMTLDTDHIGPNTGIVPVTVDTG